MYAIASWKLRLVDVVHIPTDSKANILIQIVRFKIAANVIFPHIARRARIVVTWNRANKNDRLNLFEEANFLNMH